MIVNGEWQEFEVKQEMSLAEGKLVSVGQQTAISTEVDPSDVTRGDRINRRSMSLIMTPVPRSRGHGVRGYLRAFHIVWTFALYHFFVYSYHRGWFIGGKEESEEKHLQWQAAWLSRQLLKLGPTFIKIGQSISTRADLLPLAYIKELSKLQDSVPSFPRAEAMATIERELGQPIDSLYRSIEAEPVAAASLGQVYRAYLHSGA
jgi:predicted unusual protein kinase regulating ubiquinone biosynthesis (AarF/ABC1/UbiB family)